MDPDAKCQKEREEYEAANVAWVKACELALSFKSSGTTEEIEEKTPISLDPGSPSDIADKKCKEAFAIMQEKLVAYNNCNKKG